MKININSEIYDGNIILTGFDDCIIGTVSGHALREDDIFIYSTEKILQSIINSCDDLDYDEALEHFYFNIHCAYFGKLTPIFLNDHLDEYEET